MYPYLGGSNEYWSFLDGDGEPGNPTEVKENPCQDPVKVVVPVDPPVAIHFFHQLYAGKAYFMKCNIPTDTITCGHELLKLPHATEWHTTSSLNPDTLGSRAYECNQVWGSCTMHKVINRAALLVKQATCAHSGYNSYQGFEIYKNDS